MSFETWGWIIIGWIIILVLGYTAWAFHGEDTWGDDKKMLETCAECGHPRGAHRDVSSVVSVRPCEALTDDGLTCSCRDFRGSLEE